MNNLTIAQDLLDNHLSINYTELHSVSKNDLLRLKNDLEFLELLRRTLDLKINNNGYSKLYFKNPIFIENDKIEDFKQWLNNKQ